MAPMRHLLLTSFGLLALAGSAASGTALAAAPTIGSVDRDSLEEILERARAAREAERAELRPEVESLLADVLEAVTDRNVREADRLRKKIADLGTGAGLVLLDMLDPGLNPPVSLEQRAREAARVLERLHGAALLPPLLGIAEDGSRAGRSRAIGVLGHWPDPTEVGPRLELIYTNGRNIDRDAAISALAQLGGEAAVRVFATALGSINNNVVEQALIELGRHPNPNLAPLVAPLLEDPDRCTRFLEPLLDYFTGLPDEMTPSRAALLVGLVLKRKVERNDAVELLDHLATFDLELRSEFGDQLERLTSWQRSDVAEAAQVCRARLGDAKAMRKLEEDYTARIDNARDKDDPDPYANRAEMYMRVGKPKKAERDFERAIALDGGWGGFVDQDLFIGLARANAQQGRLSQAAKALEAARLDSTEAAVLAADPVFAELLDSRYGGVLGER